MKTIEIYETNDGSRFDNKEEAIKYEEQCNKCNSIYLKIGVLKRNLKENEYIQHDPEVVKSAFKEFMRIVYETFPDYSDIAIKCGEFITPMSFLYLAIIDSGNDAFIRLMHRFYCIDFENGREFQNRMFISYQDFVTEKVNTDEAKNFSSTCATCNSYRDGKCTNFGKEVKAGESCEYYQSDVIEYTCRHCGRRYEITDSDADDREKFCCKACEYGY